MALIHGAELTRTYLTAATPESGNQAIHSPGDISVKQSNKIHGPEIWVFIENAGTQLAANVACAGAVTTPWQGVTVGAATTSRFEIAGITQHIIPANHSGWIQRGGVCRWTDDGGGVTAGNLIVVGTTGEADVVAGAATTVGEFCVGIAIATVAADDLGTVRLQIPGTFTE